MDEILFTDLEAAIPLTCILVSSVPKGLVTLVHWQISPPFLIPIFFISLQNSLIKISQQHGAFLNCLLILSSWQNSVHYYLFI